MCGSSKPPAPAPDPAPAPPPPAPPPEEQEVGAERTREDKSLYGDSTPDLRVREDTSRTGGGVKRGGSGIKM